MTWPLIIIVLLAGLALVALEIVALPGAVSGICGGVLVFIGVWQTYVQYGATAGNITLIASIFAGIIMLVILMKSGTWKRFSLKEESDSKVNQVDTSTIKIGAQGKSISRLAPAGKALFGDELVEVHSEEGFIDEGQTVEVIDIEGYRIIVKKI
ncbi:MAG: hypothetical protein II661_00130 [Bacteroidales bacterium]|nr:hypothetical protein [Bacteroidales bacterium]MBR4176456.1 hypothetical protein [Bacteroidales bacterium]MCR4931518.1 NfeD family protein [Bacteroidales bacterium]